MSLAGHIKQGAQTHMSNWQLLNVTDILLCQRCSLPQKRFWLCNSAWRGEQTHSLRRLLWDRSAAKTKRHKNDEHIKQLVIIHLSSEDFTFLLHDRTYDGAVVLCWLHSHTSLHSCNHRRRLLQGICSNTCSLQHWWKLNEEEGADFTHLDLFIGLT